MQSHDNSNKAGTRSYNNNSNHVERSVSFCDPNYNHHKSEDAIDLRDTDEDEDHVDCPSLTSFAADKKTDKKTIDQLKSQLTEANSIIATLEHIIKSALRTGVVPKVSGKAGNNEPTTLTKSSKRPSSDVSSSDVSSSSRRVSKRRVSNRAKRKLDDQSILPFGQKVLVKGEIFNSCRQFEAKIQKRYDNGDYLVFFSKEGKEKEKIIARIERKNIFC